MKHTKLIFWGIIAIGIILPLLIFIPSAVDPFIYMPEERFNIIISIFILMPLLNGIPFVILAIFAKIHLNLLQIKDANAIFYRRISGVIGAGIIALGVNLSINIAVYKSTSSTAPLAFIFLPFYASAAMPIGYFCGRAVGSLIFKLKANKEPNRDVPHSFQD